MEWMLQVADELDDALGAALCGWLGVHAAVGALVHRCAFALGMRG